jgi:hypothetical protein
VNVFQPNDLGNYRDDDDKDNPYVQEMDLIVNSGMCPDIEHDKEGHLTTVDEYDVDEDLIC